MAAGWVDGPAVSDDVLSGTPVLSICHRLERKQLWAHRHSWLGHLFSVTQGERLATGDYLARDACAAPVWFGARLLQEQVLYRQYQGHLRFYIKA